MKWGLGMKCIGLGLLVSSSSSALCAGPWQRLDRGAKQLTALPSLILIAGSAIPPLVLAPTGADYELRRFSQTQLGGSYRAESVSLWAPTVTLGATGIVYLSTAWTDSCAAPRQTSAMLQGMLATVSVVALGKWVSGRNWPNGGRDPYASDRLEHPEDARDFAPFSRGINAAFPSGHTALLFSAAAAFRASSPPGVWWRFLGYPVAAAVGFGMWFGDHHWASDILSGAMLGEAIGGAAGRAWAQQEVTASTEASVDWSVLPAPGGALLGASGAF